MKVHLRQYFIDQNTVPETLNLYQYTSLQTTAYDSPKQRGFARLECIVSTPSVSMQESSSCLATNDESSQTSEQFAQKRYTSSMINFEFS